MTRALPAWCETLTPVDMDGASLLLGVSRRFLVDVLRDHPHYEPRGNRKVFYPEHIDRLKTVITPPPSPREALVVFVTSRVRASQRGDSLDAILTPSETGSVYFVRCADRIKIGFTEHWEGRFRILKTSCPYPVKTIAVVAGSRVLELFLHRSFGAWRAHGEWFKEEGEVRELMKLLEGASE